MTADTGTSEIVVRRGGGYVDGARAYKIVIDGVISGKVSKNGTLRLKVQAGAHEAIARVDWCGSPPVQLSLKPGEVAELGVVNGYGLWKIALGAILILPRIYMFTAGANRYLKLGLIG
jgi:hypothetical protein